MANCNTCLSEKEDIKNEVNKLSYTPKLVVVQIGDNKASSIYVNNKIIGYGLAVAYLRLI